MPLPLAAIASLAPSADEATADQATPITGLFEAQVLPPLVEVKTKPLYATAASLFPSAEEATDCQGASGAVVFVQVAPAFVDT
jgi:hypothetical protein